MPADTLYEDDIVAWAEQQSRGLRELARTRPDLSNLLDWEHVAEEIEGVAQDFLFKFTGLTRQFLIHLAKALSVPRSQAYGHWRTEAQAFHDDAAEYFTRAMRQKVDIDRIWGKALRQAGLSLAEHGESLAGDLAGECPLTLDELIDPELDLDQAVSIAEMRLGRSRRANEPLS
ncbi:hypothetical protein IP69_13425 [Bosea sp. AAP35]|uniref:DUF29 family protein n=1 Tax=Bosea sp. AAP35 TaxID=1523417 RepID=UPI0006B8D944|nr:DUF29 family protein [Bosea sp. AAP35]KPF67346.1 hypothetical protein IP69_13425 [Bosea sp. AAP35]